MGDKRKTAAELESAKERLRNALTRLEHVVEKKVSEAGKDAPDSVRINAELKQKLDYAANENKLLKSENEKYAILQAKVSKRVEKLIDEVKQVVGK